MAKIRAAIIGTGGMGGRHAEGLRAAPDRFDLVAACDSNPAKLGAFSDKFRPPKRTADWREVVRDPKVDAVLVLLPHDLHEPVCVAAARAGKHILLEKPIARTLAEADRIIAAAEAASVTLMIGHNQRFDPVHRKIRDILQAGTIGEVFAARIDHHQNFFPPPDRAWWRSREAVGGGCVIGSGIHRLDLLRWYLGEAEEVFAYHASDPRRLEAEVASLATIRFRGGAIAELFCNWGAAAGPAVAGESLSLFGRQGCLYFDGAIRVCGPVPAGQSKPLEVVAAEGPYESMWVHFADCVESGRPPLTSGPEGRASLELVVAISRAAEEGRPVRLPLE